MYHDFTHLTGYLFYLSISLFEYPYLYHISYNEININTSCAVTSAQHASKSIGKTIITYCLADSDHLIYILNVSSEFVSIKLVPLDYRSLFELLKVDQSFTSSSIGIFLNQWIEEYLVPNLLDYLAATIKDTAVVYRLSFICFRYIYLFFSSNVLCVYFAIHKLAYSFCFW